MPAQSLNLLPPTEFEKSFWGRFLKWAVVAGRYIIILTELVVIAAFLSRFKLDQDLASLNAEIEQQVAILDAYSSVEDEFLGVQAKLMNVKNILSRQLNSQSIVNNLVANIPLPVKASVITVSSDQTAVSATAIQDSEVTEFLKNLKNDPNWKTVAITDLSSEEGRGIQFSLKVTK